MSERIYLHESIYRGRDQLEKLANASLTICGAGAVGSLLADNLARQGVRKLKVIDCDRVEEHNISTQLYDLSDVGAWKAEILRSRLFRGCQCEVESITKRLDDSNARKLLKQTDLVIDAFDNSASRAAVQNHCRSTGLKCLHVGLYEDYCEVIWDEIYRVPADVEGDVCEYPLARNLVLASVALASETIVGYLLNGEEPSRTATLRDFAVRDFEAPQ